MKRLLIIGLGDIAQRALPALARRYRISALRRSPDPTASGALPIDVIHGDLDRPESLVGLAGTADLVLHCAPPPNSGTDDPRTRNLLDTLQSAEMLPQRVVYLSTSGVYGDCGGERVDEARQPNPQSDRARRRVAAETLLAEWTRRHGVSLAVLRVPGIYAADRLPLARLRAGTPVLRAEDDGYTNHVHADDLASIAVLALEHEATGVFNAADDSEMKMGDWFDLVADRNGLPRPPRISRDEARTRIPPALFSFMSESRRLLNHRMKQALGVRLRYPTVFDGVPAGSAAAV